MRPLKPYPAYKDPGVRWLGDVPEHWEVIPIGRIGRLFKGTGGTKADDVADGVPCVRYGDLYTRHKFFIRSSRAFVTQERSADYTPVFLGDVLFAGSGETIEEIGKSAVSLLASPACCGGDVLLLHPTRAAVPEFLGYASDCLPAVHQKAVMGRGVTVMHIYADRLKYLWLPFPPLSEQAAIVRFLDHADRRIRRYIAAKTKLIALLNEQKQAIIHGAVTHGLDPDVRLKPSGVEWLGDAPENWEVERAKVYYAEVDDRSATGSEELLSVSHITGVTPRSEKNITMFMAASYAEHKLCREADIVINTMWAWMGALGVARQAGIVSPAYAVYRPRRPGEFEPAFVEHLLRTKPYVAEYVRRSTGIQSSRLRLYPEQFLRIPLLRPPIEEQKAILLAVAGATRELERAAKSSQHEIDLIREYRTRLISDVVTGKLDVREAAANLPDEAAEPEPVDATDSPAEGEGEGDDADLDVAEA